jgi:hypothetical protein
MNEPAGCIPSAKKTSGCLQNTFKQNIREKSQRRVDPEPAALCAREPDCLGMLKESTKPTARLKPMKNVKDVKMNLITAIPEGTAD